MVKQKSEIINNISSTDGGSTTSHVSSL